MFDGILKNVSEDEDGVTMIILAVLSSHHN